MKIRVTQEWKRQVNPYKVKTIKPGVYKVPGEVSEDDAARIVQMHAGALIEEKAPKQAKKKAPENKVAAVPESKAGVGRATKRGRRTRSKS